MDEFDPAARDAPPSRHAIESDSEDDVDDALGGAGPSTWRLEASFTPPHVHVTAPHARMQQTSLAQQGQGKPLVVLLGATGEALLRVLTAATALTEDAAIRVNDEQHGAIHFLADSTVALLKPDAAALARPAEFAYLGAALNQQLRPQCIVLVDEYHAPLYLSNDEGVSIDAVSLQDPPLRMLHGHTSALQNTGKAQPFAPPNYVTGLAAALLAEMTAQSIPATLVLVPQERSSSNPHLQALQHAQPAASESSSPHAAADVRPDPLDVHTAQQLLAILPAALGTADQQARADLALDGKSEPASSPTLDAFLLARRALARKRLMNDVSAMYM